MGGAMPGWAWNSEAVLGVMGPMAGGILRSGRIRLHGRTPNGQVFKADRLQVWRVIGGEARLDVQTSDLAPLDEQTRLGGFWLPQQGPFFAGQARFSAPVTTEGMRHSVQEVG